MSFLTTLTKYGIFELPLNLKQLTQLVILSVTT